MTLHRIDKKNEQQQHRTFTHQTPNEQWNNLRFGNDISAAAPLFFQEKEHIEAHCKQHKATYRTYFTKHLLNSMYSFVPCAISSISFHFLLFFWSDTRFFRVGLKTQVLSFMVKTLR